MDFLATEGKAKNSSAIERLADLFRLHAISAMKLHSQKRLVVEMIAGEMADVMERLRYDLMGDRRLARDMSDEQLDPAKFPRVYDYVHMSNIPDYIGGHLTTFLMTRPLLREERPSSLRFNNLLNPPEFEDLAAFHSEYLLMHDTEQIRRHFLVARRGGTNTAADHMLKSMMGSMMGGRKMGLLLFEGDMVWDRLPSAPMPYQQLLPRATFEKWMHGHFLKICLPYPRPIFSSSPVYAPLNLTSLIRLMVSMFEVGYPAHWLQSVFSQLCSGAITTTARPPTEGVTDSAAVDAKHPPKVMCVQPWAAEFTTLLSIWKGLMPFGMDSLGGALVPLAGINEYGIDFSPFRAEHERLPHFILLFWNPAVGYTLKPPASILSVLSGKDDEMNGHVSSRVLLDKAIVCVTAFTYIAASRTAVFSMRADKMEEMNAGKWTAFIWRTDVWHAVTEGVELSRGLVTRQNWFKM